MRQEHEPDTKMFLLIGLREKEVLAAFQTSAETLGRDLEEGFRALGGFPFNTRVTGVYLES
jgi:hypothetical protein